MDNDLFYEGFKAGVMMVLAAQEQKADDDITDFLYGEYRKMTDEIKSQKNPTV